MADIFVSYARQDKARVAPLVTALEGQGWSVWWDPEISGGQEFDDLIARELDAARAVIVVWTPASVNSRWVRGEAREAADCGTLVPVRFESARLPLDARTVHTIDLDQWGGDPNGSKFQELARALRALVSPDHKTPARKPDAAGISIAILPFVDMSPGHDQEYFSDGLTEELINQLAQIPVLRVAARTSSFVFKGKTEDLREVGTKLGVSHVLEGSVRKSGDRVRITAQLIKCNDGFHLWSDRFDRELTDIFTIQDDVSRAVANALGVTLGIGEVLRAPGGTKNVEAYDKYLRARALYQQMGPAELKRAEAIYREALALDPGFALAWHGLYYVYNDALTFLPDHAATAPMGMAEASARLQALAPDAWWSHAVRAEQCMHRFDWLGAEAANLAARAAAPPSEIELIYSNHEMLSCLGRVSEAIETVERLRQQDNLSLIVSSVLQAYLDIAGRPAEAQAEYERSKDLAGSREFAELLACIRAFQSGNESAAREQLHRFCALDTAPIPGLENIAENIDDKEKMLAALHTAFADPANRDAMRLLKISVCAAYHGDHALALETLRCSCFEARGGVPFRVIRMWLPLFSEVRKTQGFRNLVRDIGLCGYWRVSGEWGDFARPLGEDDFEVFA